MLKLYINKLKRFLKYLFFIHIYLLYKLKRKKMSKLSFKIVRKINSDGELGENSLAVFSDGKEINERNLGYILEMYFENVPNVTKNIFDEVLFNLKIHLIYLYDFLNYKYQIFLLLSLYLFFA